MMKPPLAFTITHRLDGTLARAGVIRTPHGDIQTPAFIVGGTKATVKALTSEQVRELGGQSVLANTYHLMLRPGGDVLQQAGGIHAFMNWDGPTVTDSGGFQVFSLGIAYKKGIDAVSHSEKGDASLAKTSASQLASVTDDGVMFRSHLDGSMLAMTPESSMELQHQIGADIHMSFDELTAPLASRDDIVRAMSRTHAWADRGLARHQQLNTEHHARNEPLQALYGIVQGARDKHCAAKAQPTWVRASSTAMALAGCLSLAKYPTWCAGSTRHCPRASRGICLVWGHSRPICSWASSMASTHLTA